MTKTRLFTATCIIPNCRNRAPSGEAFCSHHRDRPASFTKGSDKARLLEFEEIGQAFLDDHMTSETHHPDYVLVPTAAFERLRAILERKAS